MEATAATRRPGWLGVHSLNHFCIAVPDLDVARRFYAAFGLDVRESGNGLGLYAQNGHRSGVIVEGPRKAIHHMSLGIFEDDVEKFRAHLRARGVDIVDAPRGFESNGLWVRDCNGVLVELRPMDKISPNAKERPVYVSSEGCVRGAPLRSDAPRVRPRRLSHALMFAPDVAASVAFYRDTFGMRLSDQAGDGVAFLHGRHGSDHHMIAFAKSRGPGFHHCAWDVGSINEVGLGAMHMASQGYAEGWGFGRHVLGSNYFYYIRDPWGSFSEYSFDIDYVPHDMEWNTLHTTPDNGFYLWGPLPPPYFVENHEAQ